MRVYDRAGPDNTQETLDIAVAAAAERGLALVVASTRGKTAAAAIERAAPAGVRLIAVSHNAGFAKVGQQEFDPEVRAEVERRGGHVHTGTLPLRGVGSAVRKRMGGSEEELINSALRIFCQGAKVCVEMSAMVTDAGLIASDQDIVAVAGTGLGADTACVVKPMPSNMLFDIRVREFLCKPGFF
jgi:hypothetical protein